MNNKARKFIKLFNIKERFSTHFVLPPKSVLISPTNRCNLTCCACARNEWNAELNPEGDISDNLISALKPALFFAESAILHGSGEPLLSKNFIKLAKVAKSMGCRTLFHTNATLINTNMARLIVRAGINEIRPSIDGVSDDTNLELRGITFQNTVNSMEKIKKAAEEIGSFGPDIVPAFALSRTNAHELIPLVREVIARKWQGLFVARIQPRNGIEPISEREEKEIFHLCSKFAAIGNIRLILPPPASANLKVSDFLGDSSVLCRRPWDTIAVLHDGTVRPCCRGLWHGSGTSTLGYIPENRRSFLWGAYYLARAWWGRESRKLRISLMKGALPEGCRKCTAT